MKNKILIICVTVAIFAAGIVCGIAVRDFPYLALKKEVSLGEITNIFVALFVAGYIPFFLEKTINNKRTEKDILIQECRKFEKEIQELRTLAESAYLKRIRIKKDEANMIILKTRHVSKMLTLLEENISQYDDHQKTQKIFVDLKNNQLSLFETLTVNLRDRVPKITEDTYTKTEDIIYKYSGNITKLELFIINS